jgi:hypothetical protein
MDLYTQPGSLTWCPRYFTSGHTQHCLCSSTSCDSGKTTFIWLSACTSTSTLFLLMSTLLLHLQYYTDTYTSFYMMSMLRSSTSCEGDGLPFFMHLQSTSQLFPIILQPHRLRCDKYVCTTILCVPLRAQVYTHLWPNFYVHSFPTQALMAEMCAWQPFTHQTGTTTLLLYVYLNTHIRPSLHIQVTLFLPEYKLSSHIKHSVNSSLILARFANIFILFAASFQAQQSM